MVKLVNLELAKYEADVNDALDTVHLKFTGSNGDLVDVELSATELLPMIEFLVKFETDLAVRSAAGWDLESGSAVPAEPDRARVHSIDRILLLANIQSVTNFEGGALAIDFLETTGQPFRLVLQKQQIHALATAAGLNAPQQTM